MFVIEDIFFLSLLLVLGVWALISSRRVVRILVGSIYLFVILFGVWDYEPTARSVTTRHKPWTAEFTAGVSAMLSEIVVFRPYIALAAAGLFALVIKSERKRVNPQKEEEGVAK
jgi:hypothetical protein